MKHGLSRIARFRRGASVLIAILVFFLAALSGTLVLTMAASNAGRYTHAKEDQQAYFSVASAVKLILSKLRQAEVNFKSIKPEAIDEPSDIEITSTNLNGLGLFFSDVNFGDSVLIPFAYEPGGQVLTTEFDLTVDGHAEMGTVHVILLVQGSEFFFQFYVVNGESKNYQMTMRVATSFEKESAGNWIHHEDDGCYYRTLEFDVDNATFMNELLTGDLET